MANARYAAGPLHFYRLSNGSQALPICAGSFAIGLLFTLMFESHLPGGARPERAHRR